jgi:N-acyl-D-aspartate/D-glutamate deacylase
MRYWSVSNGCDARLEPLVQGFVDIHDHHDAGFDGDAEQSDSPHPHG